MGKYKRLFSLIICVLLLGLNPVSVVSGSEESGQELCTVLEGEEDVESVSEGEDLAESMSNSNEEDSSSKDIEETSEDVGVENPDNTEGLSQSPTPAVTDEPEEEEVSDTIANTVEESTERLDSAEDVKESSTENLEMGDASPYYDISENFPSVMIENMPKTGDNSLIGSYMGILVVAVAVGVVALRRIRCE